jgi:hypothetical protein
LCSICSCVYANHAKVQCIVMLMTKNKSYPYVPVLSVFRKFLTDGICVYWYFTKSRRKQSEKRDATTR